MRAKARRWLLGTLLLSLPPAAGAGDFHVDPIHGSDDTDGSAARPWRTLQTVVDEKVDTWRWQSLPYDPSSSTLVRTHPEGVPVQPGDTVWLHEGLYAPLVIQGAYNAGDVTLAAAPGEVPRFPSVRVLAAQRWVLRGFSVSPWHGTPDDQGAIVTVEDHGWQGPSADVVVDRFEVFTVPDERLWTRAADWDTKAWNGITADGDRVTVRSCSVRNVAFGISMSGRGSRVEHCTVDGFWGDGLRGLGDDEVFAYDLVKNARQVNANHVDGFQSWSYGTGGVGTGTVRNVTLRGNVFLNFDDPGLPYLASMQGIGCFDGLYEDWIVENNVVLTDHWHGISFYGARNLRIVNNTVLDPNGATPGPPWIMVTAHKDGRASTGSVVRNNLTTDLALDDGAAVADHNLELPADPSAFFADLARGDLRLAAGAPAIDAGAAGLAPALDADGVARPWGEAVDLGAYEYAPGVARPEGGDAGAPQGVAHDWPVTLPAGGATGGCGTSGPTGGGPWFAWVAALLAGCGALARRRGPGRPPGARCRRAPPAQPTQNSNTSLHTFSNAV
jgi:hypothetical protein